MPDPAATPAPPKSPDPDALARAIAAVLDENKADDIVTIDLRGKTSIADVMIIASGRSNRQVSALASRVIDLLRAEHDLRARAEGQAEGDWVLIDAKDVIVHVFRPEVRAFYALEKMWATGATPAPTDTRPAPNTRSV